MKTMLTKPQASRRTRITASIAAVALGVVSMGVATGIAEATVPSTPNPDLTAGCGSDIVLILDDSNSVWNTSSRKTAVANAAQAFADGFRDTNSTMGVVRFNTTASTVSTPIPLTGSAYSTLGDTYLNGTRPNGTANGVGQGATNWEAAFSTANSQVSNSGTRPKLVVMITDGQPTVSSDSGNGSNFSTGALDDGVTQANLIKAKGAHILTVGVGIAFDNDTYKNALTQISGTDVFPAAAWPTGQGYNRQATFVAAGANTTDSVLVTDFANLASQVKAIADAACQGSLTIQKKVINAQGQTITTGALVDGWSFSATRPNSGYAWITPNSGGAETRSSVTGQGGNLNGLAAFQWNITGSNGSVAVTETVKDGYVLDSVTCEGQNVNVSNNGFSVAVAKTASVSCVVTNKEQKRIDLELDKTIVGGAPYSVDTNRTWNLSVTNKGPADATGVVVKDYVPSGFTVNTGALPAAATLSSGVITWNVGNLAKDQTKTLDISGTLTATGSMTNWAQVTSATEIDTDSTPNNCTISNGVLGTPEDDCDKVTINVTRDYTLDIDKVRVGTGAVGVGDQVQYDLKVKNLGASTAASGLVVTDQVNAGLTNVSVTPQAPGAANWNCSATVGNAVSCTYGATLAKDSTVSVRVTATVGASLADAQSVPNTACVKKGANSTTNDDCDDETIDLTPRSDLETTKTATTPSVVTGGAATWKYSVKNLGPSVKKLPFTVTDTLPNNLTNVSISGGAGWNCSTANIAGPTSSTSFTCTFTPGVNGLAVNASTTDVTVTGSTAGVVPAQGSSMALVNKACVADDFNETTGKTGNLEGPNDCSTATVTVLPKVDLQMNKDVDVTSGASIGSSLEFSLSVTNKGPSAANVVGFTDTFPAGLTNLVVTPGTNWTCQPLAGQTLSCDWTGTLAKDATTSSVKVTAVIGESLANAASVSNTACIKADDIQGQEANDCDTTTTELSPKSDLETTKTAVNDTVVTGGNASWKFSVKNLGPSVKKSAFIATDTLPNGLTNVSISGGAGWVCSTANIAGPTSGSTFTCTFTPGVNGLAVGGSTTDVTVTGATTNVVPAQGSSTKLDNKACVADNYNENTRNAGALEGPNDCSTATVTVTPKVDLQMNKGVDVESGAVVGDTLTYSFSVTNKGPSAATVIGFTDTFDAGLTDLALQPTGANWNCSLVGQTLDCTWLGGAVAKDATTAPSVTVTAKVGSALADATSVSNTACVKADDIAGQEANDCDTTTTELDPKYSLVIDKNQVEDNPVAVGGTVTYDLTVFNQGPSKATSGFVVTDSVPSLLTVTGASSANADWDCSATSGNLVSCTWNGDDLAVGAAPMITVTATVNTEAANADAVFNTACVAKDGDQPEGDRRVALVLDENDEVLTECDTVTTEFPKGALSVGKAAFLDDDETVGGEGTTLEGFGGTITYVLGASASGNLDQTNVVVSDTVPTIGTPAGNQLNTTLVAGSVVCVDGPNGATNNEIPCAGPVDSTPNDLSWNVGTVQAGATKWVEFKVTVNVPGVGDVDTEATSFNVKNVGAATSDYTKKPEISNEVNTPVQVSRVIPNKAGDCIQDTPIFGVDGEGFYAGETVKMRVFDKDGNLVSDEYATAVADANGDVTFSNITWPGFSVTQPGNIKTYPGPQFANIQVELYGSPTSNRVTIGYPPAEDGCVANLEIEKSNNPTKDVTITEFGAEITYTMDVTAPEQNVYNSEDVVVTDVLPGYGTISSGKVSYKAGSATCDAPIAALGDSSICDASFTPNTVTWELGDMRPGDTRQVSFVVTVDIQETEGNTVADFSIFNEATVDSLYTDPVDSNVVENPVLVELTKGIEITKTASNNPGGDIADANFFSTVPGVVGEKTTFRFDVTNNSATPVSDLVLTDDNLRFAANAGAANLEDGGTPYVDSSLIENCRVGLTDDAADGFGAAFTLGSAIPGVTINPKQSVALYCDITVPVIEPESLYATDGNRIFNDASIAGTAQGLGAVENDSNVASIVLFAENLDIFPIKSIVNEDGTNPRGFDNLGKITEPTLKTFDMTIDNVSDTAYEVNLYDYFLNASPGLTKAQRDAIFDNMVCLDFDDPGVYGGNFPTPSDFASGSEFFNQFAPNDNESTTFGPATNGKGAGTFFARSAAPLLITPGDGYEVVCQTTLPTGDYSLTNAFRMVANPVQVEVDEESVARQAAAATGSLDVIATAGVVVGVPTDGGGGEEEQPGETPEPQVKGVKLPNTGLEIPVGTLMAIGIALVGAGILLGLTARRRDNAGESI